MISGIACSHTIYFIAETSPTLRTAEKTLAVVRYVQFSDPVPDKILQHPGHWNTIYFIVETSPTLRTAEKNTSSS